MNTCTKPNCDCIAKAEEKEGGPVKSYPCLADNSPLIEAMKQSRIHPHLTLPAHPDLLVEIINAITDIKIHDEDKPMMCGAVILEQMRKASKKLSQQDIIILLKKCYNAINEQREDNRKYIEDVLQLSQIRAKLENRNSAGNT